MFPVEQNQPVEFNVAVAASSASWPTMSNAASSLLYVIDPVMAQARTCNPIKFQIVLPRAITTYNLASARLASGKKYIVVTLIDDSKSARIAFASKRFVAP